MRVIKKVLIIVLILSMISFIPNIVPTVNAAATIGDAWNSATNFVRGGNSIANNKRILNAQGIYNALNFIYGIFLIAAIAFAVIKGTMIGMKIILGTIEERVDAKSMLVPYLWIVAGIAFGGIILRSILSIIMSVID